MTSTQSISKQLNLVIISVKNLEESLHFYTNTIGLSHNPIEEFDNNEIKKFWSVSEETKIRQALCFRKNSEIGQILLIEFSNQEKTYIKVDQDSGMIRGLWNINFYVENILKSLKIYQKLILNIEKQIIFKSKNIKCETMLSKYNLYPKLGGQILPKKSHLTVTEIILWLLFLSDGKRTVRQISEKLKIKQNKILSIYQQLQKNNLVKSSRGPSGGYILSRLPEDITLSSIIEAVDERIKTVGCKKESKKGCNGKLIKCITHDLWDDLENHINNFFKKNTLKDIVYRSKIKQSELNK